MNPPNMKPKKTKKYYNTITKLKISKKNQKRKLMKKISYNKQQNPIAIKPNPKISSQEEYLWQSIISILDVRKAYKE